MITFQEMISTLTAYWAKQGCAIHQGHDVEVGAGTFNPATFLRCLGPEPYAAVYVEPSRRPADARYGENPNRLGYYHQMQVIIKPSPPDLMERYLGSLEAIGLNLKEHDIRFVHDDWENPTIGAWGLGWEVWSDGMEVTQFTYFQAIGGLPVKPVAGEITYGLERLAMYLQGVDSIFDLKWNETLTYGEIFKRNEWEWSHYNFHEASVDLWLRHFKDFEEEANRLVAKHLPLPAYDFVMKASHAFNMLDARGHLSVTERASYIGRIRQLARQVAESYLSSREKMSFPLLKQSSSPTTATLPPLPVHTVHPEQKEDFLLEIGCEELPATFVPIGMQGLENKMRKLLEKEGIGFEALHVYGTPRRLALRIEGLAAGVEAKQKERKGPKVEVAFDAQGGPTPVGRGFFRSLGLEPKKNQPGIEIVDGYLVAKFTEPAVSTREVLAAHLAETILSIEFPKSMRWGDWTLTFARPIRWLVALYGHENIPFAIANVTSDRFTMGHRQLSFQKISLAHPRDYLETLRKHHVIADVQERRQMILQQLPPNVLAKERVLPQVVHLVEYPFFLQGSFNAHYLEAPQEVLISEMVEHQKYFPLADKKGGLLPSFCIISNNRPTPLIQHGHERALSPRLADGVFLYEEDLKTPLSAYNEHLKRMTYQTKLGSIWAKVGRIQGLVRLLHPLAPLADLKIAEQAALLCKADLSTLLVGEFPELQGVIGKLYALKQGEKPEIATAIDEHWMPRGEGEALPQSGAGILLSLADKIDNLLSCFALDLKPSSSSDPYALRRQGLAIHKILIKNHLNINLSDLFCAAFEGFLANPEFDPKAKAAAEQNRELILKEVIEFLMARLRTVLADYPFEKDEMEAVLSSATTYSSYDAYLRLAALHAFRKERSFSALLEINTRTKKILRSQKDWGNEAEVAERLLEHPTEKELFKRLQRLRGAFRKEVNERRYQEAFGLLTELQEPVAALFDEVKVMDDDQQVRTNRLALLQGVHNLCEELADLSKLSK